MTKAQAGVAPCSSGLLAALGLPRRAAVLAVLMAGRCAAMCGRRGDQGKTPTGIGAEVEGGDGQRIPAQILCGEDAAMAAARIATHKRTATEDGEAVLRIAAKLHALLEQERRTGNVGYLPPKMLDEDTPQERFRELKTGGMHSRRANDHSKRGEYREAVADLLRPLLRPNIDETARDKLMATMKEFLRRAARKRAEKAQDGDLSDLFDAMEMDDDGRTTAEVDQSALKSVYRKLSVKYHPDKNPDAAQRFNRIRDAYEILSDPVKTLLYDTGGMELVRKYEGDSEDLEKGDDVELDVEVDLEDVYTGTSWDFTQKRRVVCRSCRLQPSLPRCRKCKRCPGEIFQRQRWIDHMRYTIEEQEVPSEDFCTQETQNLVMMVEKGMMAGDRIMYANKASQKPKQVPGDVIGMLVVKPHRLFKRIGSDLAINVTVSLYEALLGFERRLKHLDGHIVTFGVPRGAIVRPGSGLEIAGEGMPLKDDPSSFGKLIVKFHVEFPESISDASASELQPVLRGMGLGPLAAQVTPSRGGGAAKQRRSSRYGSEL